MSRTRNKTSIYTGINKGVGGAVRWWEWAFLLIGLFIMISGATAMLYGSVDLFEAETASLVPTNG